MSKPKLRGGWGGSSPHNLPAEAPVRAGLRSRLGSFLKGLPFPGWGWGGYGIGGFRGFGYLSSKGLPDERDYRTLIGDGSGNSIVAACVNWICRTFPEAPPALWRILDDGVQERVGKHAMLNLLRFPTSSPDNPGGYYSGVLLWMATLTSWILDGNAYWLKVRSSMGRVVQLWYVPHWMILPRWPLDGSEYISYYEYFVNGQVIKVPPSEIVHFRNGLDPDNPRMGYAPLKSVLREVYSDEEAARFTASLLKNMGMPGVILSPAPNGPTMKAASEEDLLKVKTKFEKAFGGDNRGRVMVNGIPLNVSQFSFSPAQMDLSAIRDVAEERVTAVLGIPAAVVGFGAGLQTTKVGKTLAEYKDQAYEGNIVPTQRIFGSEIHGQLLPEFQPDIENFEFGFDISRVLVFQDARNKEVDYWSKATNSKIAKRSEARRALNLTVDPAVDDIYIEATASATSGGADQSAANDASQQQIDDLQAQLDEANAGKSAAEERMHAKGVNAVVEAVKALKDIAQPSPPIINVDARTMPGAVAIAKGAVQVSTPVTIEPGAVKVDAPTTIAPGAVQVDVNQSNPGFEVVRDSDGRIVGTRPK